MADWNDHVRWQCIKVWAKKHKHNDQCICNGVCGGYKHTFFKTKWLTTVSFRLVTLHLNVSKPLSYSLYHSFTPFFAISKEESVLHQ